MTHKNPEAVVTDQVVLDVKGLHKRFGEDEVVKGVSLTVRDAECVVIIGPSGCGKTTFLRCLNLLETFQEGEVWLNGELASRGRANWDRLTGEEARQVRALRQRMGMVFQQFNLFAHMSVLHNVMCGPLHVLGASRAEAAEIAEVNLRRVGLWDRAHELPIKLSGGQQQRVAIARALAMHPDVMLFDEPTSALDPELTHEVFRVIRGLVADGMTMVVVTHDMPFARDAADRVVFFDRGKIAVEGTPRDVFDEHPDDRLRQFLRPGSVTPVGAGE